MIHSGTKVKINTKYIIKFSTLKANLFYVNAGTLRAQTGRPYCLDTVVIWMCTSCPVRHNICYHHHGCTASGMPSFQSVSQQLGAEIHWEHCDLCDKNPTHSSDGIHTATHEHTKLFPLVWVTTCWEVLRVCCQQYSLSTASNPQSLF